MNKFVITAAVAVGAAAIAIPTAIGLASNPSFAEHVPVRVPSKAAAVSYDTHGNAVESTPTPARTKPSPTAVPTRSAEPGDDRGRSSEPGDDRGRSSEPGDDRGRSSEPGDDRGRSSEPGDDRGRSSEVGDDRGGRHGGGHGSDG